MVTLELSGVTYECDGVSLRASADGRDFGSALLSEGRLIGEGMHYFVIGVLNVVLTDGALAILRGEAPVPAPEPASEDTQEVQVVPVQPEVAAPKKRSRKSV